MWMQELPLQLSKTIQGKKLIVIHGAKPDISEFIFESTSIERKLEILEFLNADIII